MVATTNTITEWAVENSSRLGYFAALYKRITIAVGTAVEDGAFEDGPRMDRLDAAFASAVLRCAQRLLPPRPVLEAHPVVAGHVRVGSTSPRRSWCSTCSPGSPPTSCWTSASRCRVWSGANKLPSLHKDFDTINAVLASQIGGVVNDINELSPALADIYAVLQQHQIFVLNEAIRSLRDSAWRFATVLALEPGFARPATIWARDLQVSRQAQAVFDPPSLIGAFDLAIKEIAARESRDVAHNVRVLDEIAATPAPIQTAL